MKKTLTLIGIIYYGFYFSQEIKVSDGSENFSSGSHPAMVVTIYEAGKNDAQKGWKDKMNDFKDNKVNIKGDEVIADNILIKDWGNNTVDIYAHFEENKGDKTLKMAVAVDLGGAYLTSSDKVKYDYMAKIMKDFAIKMTKEPMEDHVKDMEKALSKLNDTQKDLEGTNKNLKRDIADYQDKIKKAETDVKTNEENQVKKKAEIEAQKKVVEEAKKKLGGVR